MRRLRLSKKIMIFMVGTLLLAGIIISLAFFFWPHQLIPAKIRKAQTSTLFVPSTETVSVQSDTFKYDSAAKLTTFKLLYGSTAITVSEQPSPELFTDIPDAYQKLVNGLGNYETFESINGTVYLTKSPNQGNKQAAVMNAKGTLIFMKADKDIATDQWKRLFNNLNIVK